MCALYTQFSYQPVQLDVASYTDSSPTPERDLLVAVMEQIFHDLQSHEHQAEAAAFVASADFVLFCEWLGWDAEAMA